MKITTALLVIATLAPLALRAQISPAPLTLVAEHAPGTCRADCTASRYTLTLTVPPTDLTTSVVSYSVTGTTVTGEVVTLHGLLTLPMPDGSGPRAAGRAVHTSVSFDGQAVTSITWVVTRFVLAVEIGGATSLP